MFRSARSFPFCVTYSLDFIFLLKIYKIHPVLFSRSVNKPFGTDRRRAFSNKIFITNYFLIQSLWPFSIRAINKTSVEKISVRIVCIRMFYLFFFFFCPVSVLPLYSVLIIIRNKFELRVQHYIFSLDYLRIFFLFFFLPHYSTRFFGDRYLRNYIHIIRVHIK